MPATRLASPYSPSPACASAPRKPYRFSQTASPAELLPLEAQQALMAVWSLRVCYWQRRPDQTPGWRWGRDSEPLEPEQRGLRCQSRILRELSIATLLHLLDIELERGLRLLLWHQSYYWGETAQATLCGVLGRVGQMYREVQRRRRGQSSALKTLLVELAKLPGGLADAPRAEAGG